MLLETLSESDILLLNRRVTDDLIDDKHQQDQGITSQELKPLDQNFDKPSDLSPYNYYKSRMEPTFISTQKYPIYLGMHIYSSLINMLIATAS